MSTKQLARIITAERRDATGTIDALRIQARAWRILTMIALVDQESARKTSQWLLFHTVPWVDGPAVEKFIAENQDRAEACGIEAGVFVKHEAEKEP